MDHNKESNDSSNPSSSKNYHVFPTGTANSELNNPDANGNTAFHTAVFNKDMQMLEYLLQQQNIDVNIQNNDGYTPLNLSISKRLSEPFIMRLIEAGCDINIANSFKTTPLHYAVMYNMNKIGQELIKRGADVDARDEDNGTPLHYAVEGDSVESLAMLLFYDADVNILDKEMRSPFTYALFDNKCKAATILFDYYDDFNNIDEDGYTALQLATLCDCSIAIQMLEAGADVNYISNNGCSVLEFSLLHDTAETFKNIWSRLDYQSLLKCATPFLSTYIRSWNHYSQSEWVECLYSILESAVAFDLMQEYKNSVTEKYSFFCELLWTFSVLDVQAKDRIAIISIYWTLGAEIYDIADLDIAIKLYGFGDELEILIYATREVCDELNNYTVPVHPLLLCILGVEDFKTEVAFELCKLQMGHPETTLILKNRQHIIKSLEFFSLTCRMKQELLQKCSGTNDWLEVSKKLAIMPDVPSLQELSRNQAHKFIRQHSAGKKPYHFHDALKKLNLPRCIRDIIRFKMPLYR